MGEKRRKIEEFKKKHPYCCYCGGAWPTENVDHAPPISLFRNRHRPNGMEVPSCLYCNKNFSAFDALVSLFAKTAASGFGDQDSNDIKRLISSSVRRFPDFFKEIMSSSEMTYLSHNDLLRPVWKMKFQDPSVHFAMRFFGARMLAAVFYETAGKILPIGTHIGVVWRTSIQPLPPEALRRLLQSLDRYLTLTQGRFDGSDQFEARFRFDYELMVGGVAINLQNAIQIFAFAMRSRADFEDAVEDEVFVISERGLLPLSGFPPDLRIEQRPPMD
jgi:hypothetical protein